LIVPTTLLTAAGSIFDGAYFGLRALGVARRSLRSQLTRAGMGLVLGLVGAVIAGAAGLVWGSLVGTLLGVALVWRQLHSAVVARHARAAAAGGAEPSSS
jgi:hypothetical protein